MLHGIDDLLRMMIEQEASDLHIKAGSPPGLRIHGELMPVEDMPPLTPDDTERLITGIMEDNGIRFDEPFHFTGTCDGNNFSGSGVVSWCGHWDTDWSCDKVTTPGETS